MNLQPYKTPPQWWSPCLNSSWIAFWRPFRRIRAKREHGFIGAEIQGAEVLQEAILAGHGILIAPNHPSHADPFALLEASDELHLPFHFMTAWQVFASTHWLGRRVLRQHGAFSVNREGHDLQAYRQAVTLLQQSRPLVVFPEGEVFHLNDRVMNFRRGAATAALRAANRSQRPVACIPCGIKYQYDGDPLPLLVATMNRLEPRVGLSPRLEMPLIHRIRRLASAVLKVKEREYFGCSQGGSTQERATGLMNSLLTQMERRYCVARPCRFVPERVKELRRLTIARQEATKSREQQEQLQHDLDDLFFVMQLFSYPADYLERSPSLERLVETIDKLEEDILQVPRASRRTNRRAIVRFGAPVLAEVGSAAMTAEDLTDTLQERVQGLLNDMSHSASSRSNAVNLIHSEVPRWSPLPI